MLSLEQKDEIYRLLCKKINFGIHPINEVAQLLADHQMSSRNYGYSRLKTMFGDMSEFITLLAPEAPDVQFRVRFSSWQRPKAKGTVVNKRRSKVTNVKASPEVRAAASAPAKSTTAKTATKKQAPSHMPLPEPPESLLPSVQLDAHMLQLLTIKTGRVQASLSGLIESSYQQAKASGTLDFHRDKLSFRLDIASKNGNDIIITFRRELKGKRHPHVLYTLVYVDDNDAPRARLEVNQIKSENPAQALENFAFLGRWEDFLEELSAMAITEEWDFPHYEKKSRYILKKYIQYTFYRIQLEGKVMLSSDGRLAAFNTGLVDRHFDDIFACFVPNAGGESPWLFKEFCIAGHRGLGKQLVQHFNPLPKAASYFERKEDLLFDLRQEIHCDYDHILVENIDRFPLSYLRNQLYDQKHAVSILKNIERETVPEKLAVHYERIRDLIRDDVLIYNRLKNRLDDAVLLSLKEVRWNYRTALPSYYPARNTMNFMLPLHLTNDESVDNVLVVELTPAGNYQGQTILTCEQAYIDARLVCSLLNRWLDLQSLGQSSH